MRLRYAYEITQVSPLNLIYDANLIPANYQWNYCKCLICLYYNKMTFCIKCCESNAYLTSYENFPSANFFLIYLLIFGKGNKYMKVNNLMAPDKCNYLAGCNNIL